MNIINTEYLEANHLYINISETVMCSWIIKN